MPLKFPRLKRHKSNKSLSDTSSHPTNSWIVEDPGPSAGYNKSKAKELPQLLRAVWKDDVKKAHEAIAKFSKPDFIDYYDKQNRTALHIACARGNGEMVRTLCECGARLVDEEQIYRDKETAATPLHKACESGSSQCVASLLSHNGVELILNLPDMFGRTPLHFAAKLGDKLVEQLIQCGVELNSQEDQGLTPLMVAAMKGHNRAVELLKQAGASLELEDSHGMTAYDLAMAGHHQGCANLLAPAPRTLATSNSFIKEGLMASYYVTDDNTFGGPVTNQLSDESVSEDLRTPQAMGDDSWATSDSEDDLSIPRETGTVNLRAALTFNQAESFLNSKAAVAPSTESKLLNFFKESKGQDETTTDPAHYRLSINNNITASSVNAANSQTVDAPDKSPSLQAPPTLDPNPTLPKDPETESSHSINWDSDDDNSMLDFDNTPVPSVMDIKLPAPEATPTIKTTPLKEMFEEAKTTISDANSFEDIQTVDNVLTDSEAMDSDLEYLEGVDYGGYVPSTVQQLTSPSVLQGHTPTVLGEGVMRVATPEKTDTFAVTPLSSGQFTAEFFSPEVFNPAQLPSPNKVGVVSNDELSDILETEDESVEQLLEQATSLGQAPPDNYNTSDWDEVTNNETDNVVQSEDERPQIEEQTTPPAEDEVQATPPAEDEEHESEASEVNFDNEDDLGDLLPTTQDSLGAKSMTASHTTAPDSQLAPILSLRNLPPLTVTGALNVNRLPPLKPIANKCETTPILSGGSNSDSETESEWEREKKEKKQLLASNQIDSGLDTMTTLGDSTRTHKIKDLLPNTSKSVDPLEVAKNNSSSVSPPAFETEHLPQCLTSLSSSNQLEAPQVKANKSLCDEGLLDKSTLNSTHKKELGPAINLATVSMTTVTNNTPQEKPVPINHFTDGHWEEGDAHTTIDDNKDAASINKQEETIKTQSNRESILELLSVLSEETDIESGDLVIESDDLAFPDSSNSVSQSGCINNEPAPQLQIEPPTEAAVMNVDGMVEFQLKSTLEATQTLKMDSSLEDRLTGPEDLSVSEGISDHNGQSQRVEISHDSHENSFDITPLLTLQQSVQSDHSLPIAPRTNSTDEQNSKELHQSMSENTSANSVKSPDHLSTLIISTPPLKATATSDETISLSPEEVEMKPHKLTMAAMMASSSEDFQHELKQCLSKSAPGLKIKSASTGSPKEATPTKGGVLKEVNDSHSEIRAHGSLMEVMAQKDESVVSPELVGDHHLSVGATTGSQLYSPTNHPPSLIPMESTEDLPLLLSDLSSADGIRDQQGFVGDLLSQSSKMSDDLPLSHLTRLNQSLRSSGGGVVSLLDSTHTALLEEGLREATQDLKHSRTEALTAERAKHRLKVQLEELIKKYNSVVSAKTSLENVKFELEHQVRDLRYQLDQSQTSVKSLEGANVQLQEQLDRLDERVTKEMEGRLGAEHKGREMELVHRNLMTFNQSLQDKLSEVSSQLQGELETKMLQDKLLKEQSMLCETLTKESHHAHETKTQLTSSLDASDKARQELQEQVSALTRANTELHIQLAVERKQTDEVKGQLEEVQLELSSKCRAQEADALFVAELNDKATLLSDTLDKKAEEIASLRAELESMIERDILLTQQVEQLKKEKVSRDDNLTTLKSQHSQMKEELHDARKELETKCAVVLERANQITVLQRESEHWQSRVATQEEALQLTNDSKSRLETQVGVANEKIAGLRQQLARAEEREQSGLLNQQRFDDVLNTLKSEHKETKQSLEDKIATLMNSQVTMREEVAHRDEKISALVREREELNKQVSQGLLSKAAVQEQLESREEAYSELETVKNNLMCTIHQLEAKIEKMTSDLTAKGHQMSDLEEELAGLQTRLADAAQETQIALEQKQSALEEKSTVEGELNEALKKVSSLEVELESDKRNTQDLESKITHLKEIRATLEGYLSETQGELSLTKDKLKVVTSEHDKATREAEESRCLWESEVRSKVKLSNKLKEMEKSQVNVIESVGNERRRTKRAVELRKGAESKLETLQRELTKLSSEAATTRTELKQAKKQVKELQLAQSEVVCEHERRASVHHQTTEGLQNLLKAAQSKVEREAERRGRAEQMTRRVQQELDELKTQLSLGKSDSQSKHKELLKLERTNRQLKDELKVLQDHMTRAMVSRAEMDQFKKTVEEKAHRELSRKLEEVNSHLEQQSMDHEAVVRMKESSEVEQRDKYERLTNEIRLKLAQSESNKQCAVTEARRYKELYEAELNKSAHYNSLLQRAKEDTADYQNRLSHERNRTQQLMNSGLVSLTPSRPSQLTGAQSTSSTPHRLTPPLSINDLSPTTSLLNTVRTKLDESIAKHLDKVPTSIGMATRITYSSQRTSLDQLSNSETQQQLDTIRKNYRV